MVEEEEEEGCEREKMVETASKVREQFPRSRTSRPSPFLLLPAKEAAAAISAGPPPDREEVNVAPPPLPTNDKSPVPHEDICAGSELSRGRLFIFTSRRSGRAERSGNRPAVRRGQCENVSLARWFRVDSASGRDTKLGE